MLASEIRASARKNLTGKWGKAALITLTYGIIFFVINFVVRLIPLLGAIISTIISLPISYGIMVSFIKLKRGEEVGYTDFLTNGFSNFGRVWGILGNTLLKMILPICIVIIFVIMMVVGISGSAVSELVLESESGIAGFGVLGIIGTIGYIVGLIYLVVKGYLYSLSFMIFNDNPDMTGKEIVEKSAELMNGYRWKYVWLSLTFIGWSILATFTLGIGMLWLMPYIMVSRIFFYEDRAGISSEAPVKDETKTEE